MIWKWANQATGNITTLLENTFPVFKKMKEGDRQKLIDKIKNYIIQAVWKGLMEEFDIEMN